MSDHANPTYFHGATLITGDGTTVVRKGGILVDDGVITAIGPQSLLTVPAGAARVDLTGKTVMPTIINPHGHIGYLREATVDKTNYTRANVMDHLYRLAYYGVSVFQSLGTDREDIELTLRDAQRSGDITDPDLPTLFSAGTGMVAAAPGGTNGGPYFATDVVNEVATADEARATVRKLAAKRPDAIKFWVDDRHGRSNKLTPEIYPAIIEQAHELGFLAIAHIYTLDDAKGVLRAGVDGLAHMVRAQAIDAELIELLQRDGVFAFTSLGVERTFYDDSDWLDEPALTETVSASARAAIRDRITSYPPDQAAARKANYAVLQQSLRTCAENDVQFVLSGDTGAVMQLFGIAEHRELESIARAGVPTLLAIQAATQRPADVLGLPDRGSLDVGKRADLLVLDADPLDDIANTRRISAVYFAGHAVDRAALRAHWT